MKRNLLFCILVAGASNASSVRSPNSIVEVSGRQIYLDLATRFNRELAGKYPFGQLSAPDVSSATVSSFFKDYESERESIPRKDLRASELAFLEALDSLIVFFKSDQTQINVQFRSLPEQSKDIDQVLEWSFSSETNRVFYPNGGSQFVWRWGQTLVFDLTWAERSVWRPVSSVDIEDLHVNGATATFVSSGPWSLLRLIEKRRLKQGHENIVYLEFKVPLSKGESSPAVNFAKAYVGLSFPSQKWNKQFPKFAPLN